MTLVFILVGAIFGLTGGWLTGAVLYKNLLSVSLRLIAFPLTVGSAAAVAGCLNFGNNGIFGFLLCVPTAMMILFCIKCIEPRISSRFAAPPDLCDTKPSSGGENTKERDSREGEDQVSFAAVGIMAGGFLGYLGYEHFGVIGGVIASTIVAAASVALVFGGIVVSFIMLVEIGLFIVPLIGSFFVALWNRLMELFYWIGGVASCAPYAGRPNTYNFGCNLAEKRSLRYLLRKQKWGRSRSSLASLMPRKVMKYAREAKLCLPRAFHAHELLGYSCLCRKSHSPSRRLSSSLMAVPMRSPMPVRRYMKPES
jgi:hypothetical protein